MDLSNSVISDDYFFILGFSALLTRELIDENYYIVDVKSTDYALVNQGLCQGRKVFAFISNDLDYYALRQLTNVTLLDRRSQVKEVLSCLLVDNSRFNYRVKHSLSERENEVLECLQEGMETHEIVEHLGMNVKTFYAHRTHLIHKLRLGNRISLYSSIARRRAIN